MKFLVYVLCISFIVVVEPFRNNEKVVIFLCLICDFNVTMFLMRRTSLVV